MGCYLLHHYMQLKVLNIVYENHTYAKDNIFLIRQSIDSDNNSTQWSIYEGGPFRDELSVESTVFICDMGPNSKPVSICNALTIVLSSPDPSHYRALDREMLRSLVMNPWHISELKDCMNTIYKFEKTGEYSAKSYKARFDLIGGVPRFIFNKTTTEVTQLIWANINRCELKDCINTIENTAAQTRVAYSLIHLSSPGPHFAASAMTFSFATIAIAELMSKRIATDRIQDIVSFLKCSATSICRYATRTNIRVIFS